MLKKTEYFTSSVFAPHYFDKAIEEVVRKREKYVNAYKANMVSIEEETVDMFTLPSGVTAIMKFSYIPIK
jgi:hypothetical protein